MRPWLSGILCVAALSANSGVASAAPASRGRTATLAEPRYAMGRSVGSPTDGHLVGGSHLDDSAYIRSLPMYAGSDDRWGLGSLVAMIDRSARAVHRQFPDAVLSVGHLSQRGGGDIDRHASHESGRDADLSFYIRSQTNHPLYSDQMVSFRGDGTTPTWPGALFDDAKNWALISAIAQETHARVTYIFVAAPLRARLLAYAARAGAPLAIRSRAAELMVQPRGSLPHDDHFHVRIGCPADSRGCIELPTATRGRRIAHGPAGHVHIGPGGGSSASAPSPGATHVIPEANPPPTVVPPEVEDHDDPPSRDVTPDDAPPAAWTAPIDDVDGPLVPHHVRRAPLP